MHCCYTCSANQPDGELYSNRIAPCYCMFISPSSLSPCNDLFYLAFVLVWMLIVGIKITELGNGNIRIVYTNNNDLCGNPKTIPRVATFLLSCAPTVDYELVSIFSSPSPALSSPLLSSLLSSIMLYYIISIVSLMQEEIDEPGTCQYQFTVNTKHACPYTYSSTSGISLF